MDRRTFMKWAIYALNGVFAVVLGVPAAAYLLDPRNRPRPPGGFRTVAKLSELTIGQPKEAILRETRRDAWTLIPNDIVGRVWLIRRNETNVDCYNTTCPHLGCAINYTGTDFLCPCHGARFTKEGERIDPNSNPAPRGMFKLPVQLDRVGDDSVVKIELRPADPAADNNAKA